MSIDLDVDEGSPTTTSTLLYIDNSNIFISAQKHAAKLNQFKEGIQDVRCRINMKKMISMALNGRELDNGVVYVSEPRPFKSELEMAFKQAGIADIKRFRKNIKLKEKEVDTALTADAVEQIVLERSKDDKVLILFTGDRDMKPVVEKAEQYGFKINLWSMATQLATEYKKKHPCIEIFPLDKYFHEVTFTETLYKLKDIAKERSFVLTFSDPPNVTEGDEFGKKIVDICCRLLHLPCQGRFYDETNFVLVICPQEIYTRFGREDEQKDLYDVNQVIGASMEDNKSPDIFKKMKKKCTSLCSDFFPSQSIHCSQVRTFVQFLDDTTRAKSNNFVDISNQYQPLQKDEYVSNGVPVTLEDNIELLDIDCTTTTTTSENNQIGQKCDNDILFETKVEEKIVQGSKSIMYTFERILMLTIWGIYMMPFFRALLLFVSFKTQRQPSSTTTRTTKDPADVLEVNPQSRIKLEPNCKSKQDTNGKHDPSPDREKTPMGSKKGQNVAVPPSTSYFQVVGKMSGARRNKSGKQCVHGFTCEKFPQCNYAHSKEEIGFLNQTTNPEQRRLYKRIECKYSKNKTCRYQQKSFLCPFAHDPTQLRAVK